MEPTAIYFGLVSLAIFIGVCALAFARGATRECPQCGDRVVLTARRCRGCQYTFS
jgi:hypothetical protein